MSKGGFGAAVVLMLCAMLLVPGSLGSDGARAAGLADMVPENTVILANETDTRFSRDYSPLLRQLRLKWIVLDQAAVPDAVRGQNLVLLARPDGAYAGEVMRALLTAEEAEQVLASADRPIVIYRRSPWAEGKTVAICVGADLIMARDAAEKAVRAMIAAAPPASDWIRTTYDAERDEDVQAYVDQLRYTLVDEELPLANLTMDVKARPRRRVSAQEAAQDMERLFYLLAHGYSGYAFFGQQGEYDRAQERILSELSSHSFWSSDALAELLHDHLSFIVDFHMTIGDYRFAEHDDFWYDTSLELALGDEGCQFSLDGATYTIVAINSGDPDPFIRPSLNEQGEPVYRLGLLSPIEPEPLLLAAADEEGEHQFHIALQRSDFDYYAEDIFREDTIGGIPVVRVRSFSDVYGDQLQQFAQTATAHRGEPVVIVDIRGNGGGNERWHNDWTQGLTGVRPQSVFIFSELESQTSIIGRANANAYWQHQAPNTPIFGYDAARFTRIAQAIEGGEREPGWTAPRYPPMSLIPNDTTVVVVMNSQVASAGEGMVMRLSQAENVIVVGENSMGALTFGNISAHRLPNSGLMVWLPINFGLYLDMAFREGTGLLPDLWVPAADAVNYAVAAIRRGTITTSQPLSPVIMQEDFVPEQPWARMRRQRLLSGLAVALIVLVGCALAFLQRKKPGIVTAAGVAWLIVGRIWIVAKPEKPVGLGLSLAGLVWLIWGAYGLWVARRQRLVHGHSQ